MGSLPHFITHGAPLILNDEKDHIQTLFTIPAIRARALESTDKRKISVLIHHISSLSKREDDLIVLQNVQIRRVLRPYYLL